MDRVMADRGYLHPLDVAVNESCRLKPRMLRYADDLVILCRPGEGPALQQRLACWLEAHGLRLNPTKTRVLHSHAAGFEFLGFSFRWQRSRKGTAYVHTEASAQSRQRLRQRIRELTRRETTWQATEHVVEQINEVTRGWKTYFAVGHPGKVFGHANYFIAHRLRQWLWRKHGNPAGKYQRWPAALLQQQYGLYRL